MIYKWILNKLLQRQLNKLIGAKYEDAYVIYQDNHNKEIFHHIKLYPENNEYHYTYGQADLIDLKWYKAGMMTKQEMEDNLFTYLREAKWYDVRFDIEDCLILKANDND